MICNITLKLSDVAYKSVLTDFEQQEEKLSCISKWIWTDQMLRNKDILRGLKFNMEKRLASDTNMGIVSQRSD